MRDGVELLADHYEPTTSTPAGTLLVRCPYGRALPVLHAVRRRVRRARLPRRVPKRAGHVRLRRRLRSDGQRDRRRRRHRRVAAPSAVVHRFLRHHRPVVSGLHPMGPARRPAAGDEGRRHHGGPARCQRPPLGYGLVRVERLPRLERSGRPPGGSAQTARGDPAGTRAACAGTRDERPARRGGRPGYARRGCVVVGGMARSPRGRRPVLDEQECPGCLETHRNSSVVDRRLAGPVPRADAHAVRRTEAARRGRRLDRRLVDSHTRHVQGRTHSDPRIARLARRPPS